MGVESFFRNLLRYPNPDEDDAVVERKRKERAQRLEPVGGDEEPDAVGGVAEQIDLADLADLHPEIGALVARKKELESQLETSKENALLQRELDEVNLHLELILKDVWHRGRYIEAGTGLKTGASNQYEMDLVIKNNAVQQAIETSPIYVTDVVGSEYFPKTQEVTPDFVEVHDQRRLLEFSEVRRMADFTIAAVKESIPNEGEGPAIAARLEKLLNVFLSELQDKKIFTRPDIQGIQDLLDDQILIQRVAEIVLEGVPESDRERAEAELYKDLLRLYERVSNIDETTELRHINFEDEKSVPLEVQLITAEDPGVLDDIQSLKAEGLDVRFQTKTRTDEETLGAIRRVSEYTQENFILSWLPALIDNGTRPKISFSKVALEKRASLEEALQKRREELTALSGKEGRTQAKVDVLQKKITKLEEQLAEFPTLEDLEADVDLIVASARGYKEVVTMDQDLTPEQQEKLERINSRLVDVDKEYARRRMIFDNADERTSEAQEILKKMMFVGPLAHGLELLELGSVAKLFASSADDLMGEWAEIQALRGSGFSLKSILSRLKVGVPVFAAASYGAMSVEALLESGHDLAAGGVFGVTAVALSLTTALQSMKMYHDCYAELVREGKIDDKHAVLRAQPEFKRLWQEFEKEIATLTPERLVELVTKALENIPEEILSAEDKKLILEQLPTDEKSMREFMEQQRGDWFKKWKKAIEQDFSNPARLGILLGSTIAPIGGMAAASLGLMSNGFVLAGIGSIESITGGVTVMVARQLNEYKYRMHLQERLAKVRGRSGSAAGALNPEQSQ